MRRCVPVFSWISSLLLCICASVVVAQTPAAPGSGKYYSSNGGYNNTCKVTLCATPSNVWQYNSGCGGNAAGVFTDCSNTLPAGYYYSASGGQVNNCTVKACKVCPTGQYTTGCSRLSEGVCSACTGLNADSVWTTPINALYTCSQTVRQPCLPGYMLNGFSSTNNGTCDACASPPPYGKYYPTPTNVATSQSACTVGTFGTQTVCAAGLKNVDYSNIYAGSCSACTGQVNGTYWVPNTNVSVNCISAPCVATSCSPGQYINNCAGTSPGTCASCTNANGTQVYSGTGSWNNQCPVVGCSLLACPTGQYTSGCGAPGAVAASTTCAACNNAVPNITYYVPGSGYYPGSCSTSSCAVSSCTNGNYLSGCGGTAQGACQQCTNWV